MKARRESGLFKHGEAKLIRNFDYSEALDQSQGDARKVLLSPLQTPRQYLLRVKRKSVNNRS